MHFAILGPLRVHDGNREIRVSAPKQRTLLAGLLVMAGRIQDTDQLIEVLWGGETGSRDALHMQMVRLRQKVGDRVASRIVTRPGGYLIEVEPDELDVTRFIDLFQHGRRAARDGNWEQATRLLRDSLDQWSGSPLQDVPSERLRSEHTPHLDEMRLNAVELSIGAQLSLGYHDTLVGELRKLVHHHPLRERFAAQLMLALYRSGRQADALAAYRDARQRLITELGIEPGAELRTLQQQILGSQEVGHPLTSSRAPAAGQALQLTWSPGPAGGCRRLHRPRWPS
jgi:DNA-binding SARP family transcriptional activator